MLLFWIDKVVLLERVSLVLSVFASARAYIMPFVVYFTLRRTSTVRIYVCSACLGGNEVEVDQLDRSVTFISWLFVLKINASHHRLFKCVFGNPWHLWVLRIEYKVIINFFRLSLIWFRIHFVFCHKLLQKTCHKTNRWMQILINLESGTGSVNPLIAGYLFHHVCIKRFRE